MARLYFARYEVYSVGGIIISSYLCDTFSHGDVKHAWRVCFARYPERAILCGWRHHQELFV